MTVDVWQMAAECARAIEASENPTRRALLATLQRLWIELGEKERLLSEQEVLKEMEDLHALHAQFLGTQSRAPRMHSMPPERPVAISPRRSVTRLKPA
jgi:hypothetical protein